MRIKINILNIILLLNIVLIPLQAQQGEVFEFRHEAGVKYRIISIVDEAVLINGELSHRAEILNRIALEITGVKDGSGQYKAIFQTSERVNQAAGALNDSQKKEQDNTASFQWEREYTSIFERDKLGRLTIAPQYFMPVVRNVPVFPGRALKPGDKWNEQAHEVHDFRDAFGIDEPYKIPFNAFYEYLGEREWKEKSYPSFSVNYNIESRPAPVKGKLYPVRISGTFNQVVFWDRSIGKERAYEEKFSVTFTMSNGIKVEYRGTAYAELVEAEQMDKEQIISEIAEEIKRLEIPDVVVKKTDEGISISLENIQFYADSDRMLPGEQEKLDKIADILTRYPDRDILVAGHAALSGGRDYLLRLSQLRAKTVADFLLSKNVRTPDRIVTRGYGAERPIASNNSEEGMSRNRRVEITILEN